MVVLPQNAKKCIASDPAWGYHKQCIGIRIPPGPQMFCDGKVYAGYTSKTDPFDVLEDLKRQNVTPVAKTKETFECHPLKFQGKWKPRENFRCACEPNMGRITQAMAPPTVDQKTVLTPSDLDTTLEISRGNAVYLSKYRSERYFCDPSTKREAPLPMERHECEAFCDDKAYMRWDKKKCTCYTKEMDVNFWGADNGSEVNSEDNTFLSDKNGTIWNIGTVLYGEKGLTPLEILKSGKYAIKNFGNPRTFADIRTNIPCKGDTFGWDDDSDSTPMKCVMVDNENWDKEKRWTGGFGKDDIPYCQKRAVDDVVWNDTLKGSVTVDAQYDRSKDLKTVRWVYTSDQALGTSPIERDRLRMVYYDPFYKYSPVYQATPTGSLGRASSTGPLAFRARTMSRSGRGRGRFRPNTIEGPDTLFVASKKEDSTCKKNMSAGSSCTTNQDCESKHCLGGQCCNTSMGDANCKACGDTGWSKHCFDGYEWDGGCVPADECECRERWLLDGELVEGCTTERSSRPWCQTVGDCTVNSPWNGMRWKYCTADDPVQPDADCEYKEADSTTAVNCYGDGCNFKNYLPHVGQQDQYGSCEGSLKFYDHGPKSQRECHDICILDPHCTAMRFRPGTYNTYLEAYEGSSCQTTSQPCKPQNYNPDQEDGVFYYAPKRVCQGCAPGQERRDGECAPCQAGTFSADGKACVARTVASCDPGFELRAGDATKDGECAPCQEGTFSANGKACVAHTVASCDPGFELRAGDATKDNECAPCQAGTFSADGKACASKTVTECKEGYELQDADDASKDSECAPCIEMVLNNYIRVRTCLPMQHVQMLTA